MLVVAVLVVLMLALGTVSGCGEIMGLELLYDEKRKLHVSKTDNVGVARVQPVCQIPKKEHKRITITRRCRNSTKER